MYYLEKCPHCESEDIEMVYEGDHDHDYATDQYVCNSCKADIDFCPMDGSVLVERYAVAIG